jgi:hypothetical protein
MLKFYRQYLLVSLFITAALWGISFFYQESSIGIVDCVVVFVLMAVGHLIMAVTMKPALNNAKGEHQDQLRLYLPSGLVLCLLVFTLIGMTSNAATTGLVCSFVVIYVIRFSDLIGGSFGKLILAVFILGFGVGATESCVKALVVFDIISPHALY